MRENKFRAWNKEQKIMVYEDEDDSSEYWDGVCISDIEMVNARFKNDDYIWLQYTGLKDKNGVEIYTKDCFIGSADKYIIVDSINFGIVAIPIKKYKSFIKDNLIYMDYNWRDFHWIWNCRKHINIIGNPYENKELLK